MNVEAEIIVAERSLKAAGDPEALREARKAAADTVAVAAAGYRLGLAPVRRLAEKASALGGPARVLGGWGSAPPLEAAAANAALSRVLNLDDWLPRALIHAGSVVVPAALAGASGRLLADLVSGVAAGYEAAGLVGEMLGASHYSEWHTTATAGSVGAAVAFLVARGVRDPEALASAIALAAAYMGGLKRVLRGESRLHSPVHAAVTGVLAAMHVESGLDAPLGVLEESCRAMGGGCDPRRLPEKPAILYNSYRFLPVCPHTLPVVEASLKLHETAKGLNIERVYVVVGELAYRAAGEWPPRSVYEARRNLKLLTAAALVYGSVSLEALEKALRDPKVLGLAEKVSIVVSDDFTKAYPDVNPALVRVVAAKGVALEETVLEPLGFKGFRVPEKAILDKAESLSRASRDAMVLEAPKRILTYPESSAMSEIIP